MGVDQSEARQDDGRRGQSEDSSGKEPLHTIIVSQAEVIETLSGQGVRRGALHGIRHGISLKKERANVGEET